MLNLVMKFSKLCNLRCTYCYEYDELANRERMPLDRLRHFLRSFARHYHASGWHGPVMFVWHGGEPLLLPSGYIREVVGLQHEYLTAAGVEFENGMQTNLLKISDEQIRLLQELHFSVGISFDVFGEARRTGTGQDSTARVLANLQRLFDQNAVAPLKVGGITVLHRGNVDRVVQIYDFYQKLGLALRLLPIFSMAEAPARMRHLTLSHAEVVAAFQQVARAQFRHDAPVPVLPLDGYLEFAVAHLGGLSGPVYDPAVMEWALIVNTNGDAYSNGESYLPEGWMGNIFEQEFSEVWNSAARRSAIAVRSARAQVCRSCRYSKACSHLPMIEALPSERAYDPAGNLRCPITEPMIAFMVDEIRNAGGVDVLAAAQRNSRTPLESFVA